MENNTNENNNKQKKENTTKRKVNNKNNLSTTNMPGDIVQNDIGNNNSNTISMSNNAEQNNINNAYNMPSNTEQNNINNAYNMPNNVEQNNINTTNMQNNMNNNNIGNVNNNQFANNQSNTYNSQNGIPNPKKFKHGGKKKHRFIKFLLIVAVIIAIIIIFNILRNNYKEKKFEELVKEAMLVMPNEEIELTEEQLQLDSNSDGLTNKQKIEMGLDILSDDTDEDGLTDYDEINVYGTDPTKFSTSGDVLSDGYKVQNGYDVKGNYGNTAQLMVADNKITLTADEATDIQAYYKEYVGTIPGQYTIAMTPFRVYSFTGQTEVLIENPEQYEVISYDNISKKETKIENTTTDKSIIFNISNDNPIIIAYKQDILKKLGNTFNSNINNIFNNNKDSEYIVITMPILNQFFGEPIYVLEINDNPIKGDENVALQNRLTKLANGAFSVQAEYISTFASKLCDFIFKIFENTVGNAFEQEGLHIWNYILTYKHVKGSKELENYLYRGESQEDKEEEKEKEEEENTLSPFELKYQNKEGEYSADSGFSVYVNAFNFQNLSTEVSNGGVCLGFAHVTTSMYNGGNIAKSIKDKYDLSSNSYDTIWNKKLYSYKAESSELSAYADDKCNNEPVLDSSKMEKPDSEVVKALEYYWDTVNDDLTWSLDKFRWAFNNSGNKQTYINSKTIDKVVEKFKNGEIVTLCLLGEAGGHAINGYKIVEDADDPDILYLKAYDNNFPGDMWWNKDRNGKQKYDVTITLKRCYKNKLFGGVKTYYLFDYNPLNMESYHYQSINGGSDFIMFSDENSNIL